MATGFKFPDEQDDDRGVEIELTDNQHEDDPHNEVDESKITRQPATEPKPKPKPAPADEDDEDDVDIEIVDDTPEQDRGRKPLDREVEDPTDEELEEHSTKVQKRLRELTRARHDERRRADALAREKAELERVARALNDERTKMQEYISMGQSAYIEKSKQYATIAMESAKSKLRQAYDAGDSEAIAAAQQELTTAQMALQEANNFRAAPLPQKEQQAYNQPQRADRAPAQPQIDDRTMDWASRNPWFQREGDEDMTGFAMGVHAKLVREHGEHFTQTPDYYKRIDNAMRKAFPDRFEDDDGEVRKAPAAKRPSTVVAPAQRSTKAKKIRLTQTQVNIAKRLGVSLEGYARQLAALEKENG